MTRPTRNDTFQHIILNGFGIENLVSATRGRPIPRNDEILVRIQAAALNYVDLAIVEGKLGADFTLPFVPVADGAGIVEEVGTEVSEYSPGDLVTTVYIPSWTGGRYTSALMGLDIRPGAGHVPGQLSELKLFKREQIIHAPRHLSAVEAATLPIAGVTAWNALVYGRVKPGQTVLIHGTGGVAVFALQFAKAFGARVIITSSSDAKLEQARKLGADSAVNYKTPGSIADKVLRITENEGVDLVVETVGGTNLQESLRSLRPEGHISVVGFLSGVAADLNLIALNLKRATLTGVSVGSRQDCEDMFAAISQHRLRPVVGATFPLSETRKAFAFLKAGAHFGKVVITLDSKDH